MRQRFFTSMALAVLVATVASLSAIAGQAPAPAGKAKPAAKTFKTAWGDPDLQGVWNDATSTPLQRPTGLAGKQVLTDEEAEDFQEDLAETLTRDRRDGGAEADVARAYNDHWMDARRL